jgi:tRNA threonylcarbamoyladenosine biosynthesis protein TsaE
MQIASTEEMEALGARLAAGLASGGGLVFLHGPLGAGKTTLVRGLLHALGHGGSVKSPTYALLESYALAGTQVHHLDLYRLRDADELEFIGLRELLDERAICLIEWPDRGADQLPMPDVELWIEAPEAQLRTLRAQAAGARGAAILAATGIPCSPVS